MRIEVKLTGGEAIRRKLQQIGELSAFRALAATAEDAQTYITGEVAKHKRPGGKNALERSIYLRRIGPMAFEVGHDLQIARHALFVHWGTKPHVIRSKNKKVLRWPVGGKFVFACQVRHPGYKGYATEWDKAVPAAIIARDAGGTNPGGGGAVGGASFVSVSLERC